MSSLASASERGGRAPTRPSLWREAAGPGAVAAIGLALFWLFPDDLGLMTLIASTALYVLSLDLVLGYCGVVTLGQAALFGAGAYAAGIAAVHGLTDPFALLVVGALAGAVLALATGALILHARGLALLMLTIAIAQMMQEAASKARDLTGGSDGLSGITPDRVLGLFDFDLYGRTGYLFALAVLLGALLLARRIVRSPFGLACRAVREDPLRVAALGGTPWRYRVTLYAVAGGFAGLAGAVQAVTSGIVGLDSLGFDRSAEALVMLVLGGTGRLYGALAGTLLFMAVRQVLASSDPFHWMLFIGLFLIVVVLFAPGGVLAGAEQLYRRLTRRLRAGGGA